jgi:hypothetical protein
MKSNKHKVLKSTYTKHYNQNFNYFYIKKGKFLIHTFFD